jgi:hypothetical protein
MALDLAGILKYWNWYPRFMSNVDHKHQKDTAGLTYLTEIRILSSCVTTSWYDKTWTSIFNIMHLSCNKDGQVK